LIVKLNSLKEITVNSRDIFEELDIEDLIRTVVIALYNRYYSDYKSDKPEYKNKFTHNSIYRNYGDFCVLFNALMSEIEYERIGIDTAKSMPEPAFSNTNVYYWFYFPKK
jgi:hypothetical protein